MIYNVGFIPSMYVAQVMCENKEKRQRSAKRNYQRMVYEFTENNCMERFGDLLDDEMGKIREINRNGC